MKRLALVAGLLALLLNRGLVMAGEDPIDLKALEKSVDKALKAYNEGDSKAFWADFSATVNALKTKEAFDAIYTNGYKKLYGDFVKRGDLVKDKSVLEGEIGLVRYKAEFDKDKKLEIDVNWIKEDKKIKFMQIQINKPQE
jgi:hypothetical protein